MIMYLTYYQTMNEHRYELFLREPQAIEHVLNLAKKEGLLDKTEYGQKALLKINGASYFIKPIIAPIRQGEVPYLLAPLGDYKDKQCPNCGYDGNLFEYQLEQIDNEYIIREYECPECNTAYRDVFTYAGRETAD